MRMQVDYPWLSRWIDKIYAKKTKHVYEKNWSQLDLSSLDLTTVSLTTLNISCTFLSLYLIQYVPCEDGVTDLHVDCGI